MVFPVFLAAALSVDQARLDEGDRLNEAYVGCLFAVARSARSREVPKTEFSTLLAKSCQAEREKLHASLVAILEQRGNSSAAAEAQWTQLEAQGRAAVERAYAFPSG